MLYATVSFVTLPRDLKRPFYLKATSVSSSTDATRWHQSWLIF